MAPVAQAQPRSGTVTQCGSSTSSKFLENLQILSNYIYDPNKGKNSLPSGSPVDQVSGYCSAFTSAYNLATSTFKNDLDSLTNTFIDTDSCGASAAQCAWAFKDVYTKGTGNTYVALSSSFFDSTGAVTQVYSQFISSLVSALLGATSPIAVQVSPQTWDTPDLALIAALAHEVGHVKWYQNKVEKLNKTSKTCPDPFTGQYIQFADITWNHHDAATPKWRYFGVGDGNGNQPYGQIGLEQLKRDLGNPVTDLQTIFNGSWASIFATVSPDEDYIETYAMMTVLQTLFQTFNSDIQITLANGGPLLTDIGNDYLNSTDRQHRDFNHKILWIQACAP